MLFLARQMLFLESSMSWGSALLLAGSLSLAGCFSPEHQECKVQCSSAGLCPPDLTCGIDGYCHGADSTELCSDNPIVDAAVSDVPVFDGGADAAVTDAGPDAQPDATPIDAGTPMTEGDLIISEIMKDPEGGAGAQANREWFEVHNTTAGALDMQGMTLSDNGGSFVVSGPLVVPGGGYVVMARNGNPLENDGILADYEYGGAIQLSNNGDRIVLTMPSSLEIDRVVYDGVNFPDTKGRSLSLSSAALDYLLNDVASNWCDGTNNYSPENRGTPGSANPLCP